jgi:hypothetical protein
MTAICPRCKCPAYYEITRGMEFIDCYQCGYHYEEPPIEVFGVGVIHIEHGKHIPGQIYLCKDEEEKDKITTWLEKGFFQPVTQAYYTFFKDHSLHQEQLL